MCFKNKQGQRLIMSRRFINASGHIFRNIKVKTIEHSFLVFDVVYKKGDMEIIIQDENGNQILYLNNPKTDKYDVVLNVNHEYKLLINLRKASGGYRFYL